LQYHGVQEVELRPNYIKYLRTTEDVCHSTDGYVHSERDCSCTEWYIVLFGGRCIERFHLIVL